MATNVIPVENVTGFKWGSLVLLGVLSVIFGLLVILFPTISATVLVELLGILILVLSFAAVMLSHSHRAGGRIRCFFAVLGIIGFFFGIATIIHPIVMGLVIFFVAGIALFLGGLHRARARCRRTPYGTPRPLCAAGNPRNHHRAFNLYCPDTWCCADGSLGRRDPGYLRHRRDRSGVSASAPWRKPNPGKSFLFYSAKKRNIPCCSLAGMRIQGEAHTLSDTGKRRGSLLAKNMSA